MTVIEHQQHGVIAHWLHCRNRDIALAGDDAFFARSVALNRKRKLVPTVDGVSFQAARSSTAPLQFQGRSSLSLEARCPRANWSMA